MKICISQPNWQEISRFCLPHALFFLFPCCSYYFFLPCLPPCRKSEVICLFPQAHHSTTFTSFNGVLFNFAKPQKAWLSQHCLQTAALIEYAPEPNLWVFPFLGSLQGGGWAFGFLSFVSFNSIDIY